MLQTKESTRTSFSNFADRSSNESDDATMTEEKNFKRYDLKYIRIQLTKLRGRKCVLFIICLVLLASLATYFNGHFPECQLDKVMEAFFGKVENHLIRSLSFLFCLVAFAVVFLIPASAVAVSGGILFTKALGYKEGIIVTSTAVWLGAAFGYSICFFVGRYVIKEKVKRIMMRNYPSFEKIDVAISESALLVLSLLHLAPIVPFGSISYVSGSVTSIPFHRFIVTHIAAIPHYVFYVFIGASTTDVVSTDGKEGDTKLHTVVSAVLSVLVVGVISVIIKKKLKQVLSCHEQGVPNEDASEKC